MKKQILLIIAVSVAMVNAQISYYVSPTGSDGNNGTSTSTPFLTIAKARDAAKALGTLTQDVNIYLRGGWYVLSAPLTFDGTNSGTGGHKIIYQAYSGEYPVISGGQKITTTWTLHDATKNIWKTAAVAGMGNRQLYVNCIRAIRAHSASGLPGVVKTTGGYTTTDQTMQNWGNKSDIEFVYNAMQGGTNGANWTEKRVGVASISGATITMKTPGWTNANSSGMQGIAVPSDIENAYELLDQSGEWYLDKTANMIYYIPRSYENLSTATVIVPILETLISGAGTTSAPISNIQFKGITFAHATWLRPSGNDGFPEWQSNNCNGYGWAPANVTFTAARSLLFERCIFKHLGAMGLNLEGGSQDCKITGCVFTDISGVCIKIGNTNDATRSNTQARDSRDTIVDSYIHNAPCEYHGGAAILAGYVSEFFVSHNEIANTPYSGMSCGWGWGTNSYAQNNHFTGNKFNNFCQLLGDGGGIYTLSSQPGTVWDNNWFDGMPYRDNGAAIYPDEGSANMEIHHNVCSNIGNKWLHIWTNSINNINIHDIWSNTANTMNNGTSITISNVTIVSNTTWPTAAQNIMNASGIETSWQDVRSMPCGCSILSVAPTPVIISTPITTASVNVLYSYTVSALGRPLPTVSASGLPSWLSFNATTATLSGTPTTAGTTGTITITATNSEGNITQTFTITVLNSKIRYYPRSSWGSRMTGGVFEGTNGDPANGPYTELYTITATPTEGQWTEVAPRAALNTFRYVRYRSPSGSYGNVSEIEFYNNNVKLTGTTFGTPGSWNNSGSDYTKAFDGSTSTYFDYNQANGAYTGLDLGTTKNIPLAPVQHKDDKWEKILIFRTNGSFIGDYAHVNMNSIRQQSSGVYYVKYIKGNTVVISKTVALPHSSCRVILPK